LRGNIEERKIKEEDKNTEFLLFILYKEVKFRRGKGHS
jgi:hypothetical protein